MHRIDQFARAANPRQSGSSRKRSVKYSAALRPARRCRTPPRRPGGRAGRRGAPRGCRARRRRWRTSATAGASQCPGRARTRTQNVVAAAAAAGAGREVSSSRSPGAPWPACETGSWCARRRGNNGWRPGRAALSGRPQGSPGGRTRRRGQTSCTACPWRGPLHGLRACRTPRGPTGRGAPRRWVGHDERAHLQPRRLPGRKRTRGPQHLHGGCKRLVVDAARPHDEAVDGWVQTAVPHQPARHPENEIGANPPFGGFKSVQRPALLQHLPRRGSARVAPGFADDEGAPSHPGRGLPPHGQHVLGQLLRGRPQAGTAAQPRRDLPRPCPPVQEPRPARPSSWLPRGLDTA